MISAGRLVAIVSPDSAPIKRMVQEARDRGTLIDATYGRRTRSVLIMDNDHLVLSALQPDTVASRLESRRPLKQRRMRNDQKEREGTAHRLSGPSGVGKSTVIAELLGQRKGIYFSVSYTTRQPGWERQTGSTTTSSPGRSSRG